MMYYINRRFTCLLTYWTGRSYSGFSHCSICFLLTSRAPLSVCVCPARVITAWHRSSCQCQCVVYVVSLVRSSERCVSCGWEVSSKAVTMTTCLASARDVARSSSGSSTRPVSARAAITESVTPVVNVYHTNDPCATSASNSCECDTSFSLTLTAVVSRRAIRLSHLVHQERN